MLLYNMDVLSYADVLDAAVGCTNISELFEAPKTGVRSKTRFLPHHTIFTVDTTLSRKDRIRKPSARMKEYTRSSDKRSPNSRLKDAFLSVPSLHFLRCNEDASFMFRPLDPDTRNAVSEAKGALPEDADQLDTEEYDELQLIYESVNLGPK